MNRESFTSLRTTPFLPTNLGEVPDSIRNRLPVLRPQAPRSLLGNPAEALRAVLHRGQHTPFSHGISHCPSFCMHHCCLECAGLEFKSVAGFFSHSRGEISADGVGSKKQMRRVVDLACETVKFGRTFQASLRAVGSLLRNPSLPHLVSGGSASAE